MRCEDVVSLLMGESDASSANVRRAAIVHLCECADCRDALRAVRVLHAEAELTPPLPSPGAFERAVHAATRRSWLAVAVRRPTFWSGVGVGLAAAATVVLTVLALLPSARAPVGTTAPGVMLAVNETRDLAIALDSPVALMDAEIRVVLSGAIGLAGFEGRKELSWSADLEAGVNQLTLPVVALGADGGQLTVEVVHGERRRIFIVDVRTNGGRA